MDAFMVKATRAYQYDGKNMAEIVAGLNSLKALVAEDAGTEGQAGRIHLSSYGGITEGGSEDTITVQPGDWVRLAGDWAEVIPASVVAREWIIKA